MNPIYFLSRSELSQIRLFRASDGSLRLEQEGKASARVTLIRSFPYTMPDRFISVRSADGHEIAMIQDVKLLNGNSLQAAREELDRKYMIPVITQILTVRKRGSGWHLQADTNYGPAALVMENLHESIQPVAESRWIVTDNEGRRFELSDPEQMDARSREHWKKLI
ncbi:hypothetical protein FHS16_000325 [Paenibacillus endophyticus]|uniref:DUF1854 domain-containing protein n=1 Tax=Paenibacillus endophyticus TaxID=1294268 RepID=A0A7W5G8I6_9BACL|nr:DUF1854 domain-containing protein [Paenibacillus endophyticus]MBB3150293.1 hypothetical protein [Paenibacillus endophyticus]